jgi:hypothetical protein
MAQIEYKFNVIKQQDVFDYLNSDDRKHLDRILRVIIDGRLKDNRKLNDYWICNQDEPYADKIINIILKGEDNKL